jgi:hypothetical protein
MNSGPISDDSSGRGALGVFRRYVYDFVNRHDFRVLPEIMASNYTLFTAGHEIRGRDGSYRQAVAQQLEQFPGLVYTLHEIHVTPDAVAVHFTEHGASNRHQGLRASWGSIAIYRARDGALVNCAIEQDFYSRRRQLASGEPLAVPSPAIAPWDTLESPTNAAAEAAVHDWLADAGWESAPGLKLNDGLPTLPDDPRLQQSSIEMLDILSAGDVVAFRALQRGKRADANPAAGESPTPYMHIAGLVRVSQGSVISGHVIQDRLGLSKRLR